MQSATTTRPLALRNLQKVDFKQPKKMIPVNDWNWTPSISDPRKFDNIVASGGNTTSKATWSSQTDHGESY